MVSANSIARLLLVVSLVPGTAALAGAPELSFEMKDQFDRVHTDADYRGSLVVLIGSDKNGARFNVDWTKAIAAELNRGAGIELVRFIGLADLRGVPFFLKGMVKGKFPQEPDHWALMDWKGRIAKTYEFQPEASNILVFDQAGTLVFKTHGREVDDEEVERVVVHIRGALPVSD